jgi:hypothetical protein
MTALDRRNVDDFFAAEEREEIDAPLVRRGVGFAGRIAVRTVRDYNAPPGAVDTELVTLPRGAEVAGIDHRGAATVAHSRAVGVLDVDLFVINIPAPSRRVLRVVRQPELVPTGPHGIVRRIILGGVVLAEDRTTPAFLHRVEGTAVFPPRAQRPLGAVVVERPEGEDRFRHVAQPPVDQVEMMAALVDAQSPGLRALAVPAVEIRRAMPSIEVVHEFDIGDPAEFAPQEHALQGAVGRGVAHVVGNLDAAAALFLGRPHASHLLGVDDHRLFHDDVAARLQPRDDVAAMGGIGTGDHERLRPGLGQHAPHGTGRIPRHRAPGLGEERPHALAVRVEDPREHGAVVEVGVPRTVQPEQGQGELVDAADAQSGQRVFLFFHGEACAAEGFKPPRLHFLPRPNGGFRRPSCGRSCAGWPTGG